MNQYRPHSYRSPSNDSYPPPEDSPCELPASCTHREGPATYTHSDGPATHIYSERPIPHAHSDGPGHYTRSDVSSLHSRQSRSGRSQGLRNCNPFFSDLESGRESLLQDETVIGDERRLVIGVDFGTTYTGVAWATPADNHADLGQIDIVDNWGDQMGNSKKIPSVISYTTPESLDENRRQYQQWGSNLSDNAVAIVNTKLQLDIESVVDELRNLRSILQGVHNLGYQYVEESKGRPNFPWKSPEQIVTDYLKRVFRYIATAVDVLSPAVRRGFPTDIVATIPTGWDYPAINSTYRALTKAGFNKKEFDQLKDVILVREPEAAAVYTARYLKDQDNEFLRLGDCFVLCDAGGGTVDLVSYKVRNVNPLELELVGIPTSHKSGSTYIDLAFKRWLKSRLGDHYQLLDPDNAGEVQSHTTEGTSMRMLMETFNREKKRFTAPGEDIAIILPPPLDTLNLPHVIRNGVLTIQNHVMKCFFDGCVDKIITMIDGQIDMVDQQLGFEVRDVILVGGFGESEYLRRRFDFAGRVRCISVRVPDTAWTAIVRGAVVVGIEKSDNTSFIKVKPCPRNYGFQLSKRFSLLENEMKDREFDLVTGEAMATGQMQWVIREGDAMLSTQHRREEQSFIIRVTDLESRKGGINIYEYPRPEVPTRFKRGDPELRVLWTLEYDLKNFSSDWFERRQKKKQIDYYAALKVKLLMYRKGSEGNDYALDMALYLRNRKLSEKTVDV